MADSPAAEGTAGEIGVKAGSRTGRPPGYARRFMAWAGRVNLERKLAVGLVIATAVSGTVTFMAMTDNMPVKIDAWSLLLLLNLDLVLLLVLSALIARRLVIIWAAHKRGLAGAHLHARLVALFSLVAVTPTIIVATFSVGLFDVGLQGWFSERVRTAVEESFAVAHAYLEEHRQTISADALAIAQDLQRDGVSLALNPQLFNRILAAQAGVRSLTEVIVFDRAGRILGRAGYTLLLDFDPDIPDWALRRAADGEVVILTADTEDRVRALLRLDGFPQAFLLVGRLIDPRVLGHIDRTENAVKLYQELEGKRADIQITFALVFVVVALMLLMAAVWVGLAFANRLSRPIAGLISAAERVGSGDLSARVDEADSAGEIGSLSRAFNRMTGELESQRGELLEANRELDSRSRFIEAVLGGVSAGLIGLNERAEITLPNRLACDFLSAQPDQLRGRKLQDIVPEMAALLDEARRRPHRLAERTIMLARADGATRHVLVRIATELGDTGIIGFVVTFDDVTELLSAQRKAAWADVARRIAHEIKNPLTPIQLSAERLKRRYLDQIQKDPETFRTCTEIIVRQVADIGRMVDEFSSFARMPAPEVALTDLSELIRQAVFLQRGAHPEVAFTFEQPDHAVTAQCDREQIGRAVTNLLQNSVDAIARRPKGGADSSPPGQVTVRLVDDGAVRAIEVEDNGCGLPKMERHRLTEPYVTTRDEGTGLGLAIVKKIMEDHGGDLQMTDRPGGGARVRLIFPWPDQHTDSSATATPLVAAKTQRHGP